MAEPTKEEIENKIEKYKDIVALNPNDTVSRSNLAYYYYLNKQISEAEVEYKYLIQQDKAGNITGQDGTMSGVYNNLAVIYFNLNEFPEKRLEYLKKAYELDKDSLARMENLSGEYIRNNKFYEAQDIAEKMIVHKDRNINDYMIYWNIQYLCYMNLQQDRDTYLQKGIDILTYLYTDKQYSSSFKEVYPQEAYLTACIAEVSSTNNQSQIYLALSQIYQSIMQIKNLLIIDPEEKEQIVHYTSLNTLQALLNKDSRFRVSNTVYLNDPSEGIVFNDILEKYWTKDIFEDYFMENEEKNKGYVELKYDNTFIASFSEKEDILPMWVQYGEDAKGCAIFMDKGLFSKDAMDVVKTKLASTVMDKSTSESNNVSYSLYSVEYVDENNNIKNNDIPKYMKEMCNVLETSKKSIGKGEDYQIILDYTKRMLQQIRYLFKLDTYQHEKEMRLVLFRDIKDTNIAEKTDKDPFFPKLYVNVEKDLHFPGVVLGAKVSRPEEMVPYILKTEKVDKVYKSGIHYK